MTESTQQDIDIDSVTPLDLFDAKKYTNREERNDRLSTCKGCERLFKMTGTCKECGCFMGLKTWLTNATCPLGKW